jgi:hypothetical protein
MVEVLVPLIFLARAWKAAKFFGLDSSALIEKTIPIPQWPVCPQYPQIGLF